MKTLAVLIAKSGVRFLNRLPRRWETVVVDYSRLDQRQIRFWNYPSDKQYDEIIIIDQNITTALTQRKIEMALREMGIRGKFKYAGNAITELGYRHMDYVLDKSGLLSKEATAPQGDLYKLNKYDI